MSVYLDSTFAPKLDYLDFRQEGWRLEHQDPNGSLFIIHFFLFHSFLLTFSYLNIN